jgi:hypothetical protein
MIGYKFGEFIFTRKKGKRKEKKKANLNVNIILCILQLNMLIVEKKKQLKSEPQIEQQ